MAREIKLKDIAEELGISVVTVSNALSGKKGVSDSVRKQVQEKALQLGYDVGKYQKKDNGSMKIGVIVSEKYLEVGASFYWAMYQQVAYAASKKQGFTMFEILEKGHDIGGGMPRILKEGEIDGLIVIGWVERDYIKRILQSFHTPVVLLDFYGIDLACDAVMSSNYVGMYKMTRYLLERGHKDIAFVGNAKANENIMDRFFGYRKGMMEWGIPLRKDWIINDRDADTGDMVVELPKELPTAFVCNSDLTASMVYDKLSERGMKVPEDVSIVGYDNYLYGHPFAEEVTTYHVDMEQMAKTAVKILLDKVRKGERHQGVRYIDSDIVERRSVKAL